MKNSPYKEAVVICAVLLVVFVFIDNGTPKKSGQSNICYSDEELLATFVTQQILMNSKLVSYCSEKTHNRDLPKKWEKYISINKDRISEAQTLVNSAYQRNFGKSWKEKLRLDNNEIESSSISLNLGNPPIN